MRSHAGAALLICNGVQHSTSFNDDTISSPRGQAKGKRKSMGASCPGRDKADADTKIRMMQQKNCLNDQALYMDSGSQSQGHQTDIDDCPYCASFNVSYDAARPGQQNRAACSCGNDPWHRPPVWCSVGLCSVPSQQQRRLCHQTTVGNGRVLARAPRVFCTPRNC